MKFPVIAALLIVVSGTAPGLAEPMRGVNGHSASGSATIASGQVELGSDFRFDGGPDVYVAVKQGGKIQLLGKLRDNSGAQSYALPAGGDGPDEILLFCKQYNVTLGKAAVN
ncbi:MAG: hypothetical protein COC12_03180 [Rhodobacteraceae bacterium]|nr:MAG: hypothetical protein COC12_03180 [Paracoccaceae bacterium]